MKAFIQGWMLHVTGTGSVCARLNVYCESLSPGIRLLLGASPGGLRLVLCATGSEFLITTGTFVITGSTWLRKTHSFWSNTCSPSTFLASSCTRETLRA